LEPKSGEVRRRRALGTEALYRIIEPLDGGLVLVEVIRAPGLEPGAALRLTADAVAGMEVVDPAEAPAAPPEPARVPRVTGEAQTSAPRR